MDDVKTSYLNLAAYNRRRMAYHLANGDVERATTCERNAKAYDDMAAAR